MSISEMTPRSPFPGPYRDYPEYSLLEKGLCPHSGQPCGALKQLSADKARAVQQLRDGLAAADSAPSVSPPRQLQPDEHAVLDAFMDHTALRRDKISRVLGGNCAGGCELTVPPA